MLVFNIYNLSYSDLFSRNSTPCAPLDKTQVFARSALHHFLTFHFLTGTEKNPICKARHDEDSNVTDHFDNRRLSKRSVTSDFFFPRRAVTSLPPPDRPRVTTLTTATGRHYRLRLSLLTTFIAEDTYLRPIRPVASGAIATTGP